MYCMPWASKRDGVHLFLGQTTDDSLFKLRLGLKTRGR